MLDLELALRLSKNNDEEKADEVSASSEADESISGPDIEN